VALQLRHVERLPLGMTYPAIVDRLVQVARSRELAGKCHLTVDGTGVGRPVVDLLRDARPGCGMTAVTITGGDRESTDGGYVRVPKRDLITGLQLLLQGGELAIAAGLAQGATLVAEMAAMQVRVTEAGNEQYGSWREGTHDDMVLAVALACWTVRKKFARVRGQEGWWV
jgi:hypothetical protein